MREAQERRRESSGRQLLKIAYRSIFARIIKTDDSECIQYEYRMRHKSMWHLWLVGEGLPPLEVPPPAPFKMAVVAVRLRNVKAG